MRSPGPTNRREARSSLQVPSPVPSAHRAGRGTLRVAVVADGASTAGDRETPAAGASPPRPPANLPSFSANSQRAEMIREKRGTLQRVLRELEDLARRPVSEESFQVLRSNVEDTVAMVDRMVQELEPELVESLEEMRALSTSNLESEVAYCLRQCLAEQEDRAKAFYDSITTQLSEVHTVCADEVQRKPQDQNPCKVENERDAAACNAFCEDAQAFREQSLQRLVKREKDRTHQFHGFCVRYLRGLVNDQFKQINDEVQRIIAQSEQHRAQIVRNLALHQEEWGQQIQLASGTELASLVRPPQKANGRQGDMSRADVERSSMETCAEDYVPGMFDMGDGSTLDTDISSLGENMGGASTHGSNTRLGGSTERTAGGTHTRLTFSSRGGSLTASAGKGRPATARESKMPVARGGRSSAPVPTTGTKPVKALGSPTRAPKVGDRLLKGGERTPPPPPGRGCTSLRGRAQTESPGAASKRCGPGTRQSPGPPTRTPAKSSGATVEPSGSGSGRASSLASQQERRTRSSSRTRGEELHAPSPPTSPAVSPPSRQRSHAVDEAPLHADARKDELGASTSSTSQPSSCSPGRTRVLGDAIPAFSAYRMIPEENGVSITSSASNTPVASTPVPTLALPVRSNAIAAPPPSVEPSRLNPCCSDVQFQEDASPGSCSDGHRHLCGSSTPGADAGTEVSNGRGREVPDTDPGLEVMGVTNGGSNAVRGVRYGASLRRVVQLAQPNGPRAPHIASPVITTSRMPAQQAVPNLLRMASSPGTLAAVNAQAQAVDSSRASARTACGTVFAAQTPTSSARGRRSPESGRQA